MLKLKMSMYAVHRHRHSERLVGLDKVGLGSSILDSLLNHFLHFVPVASIDAVDDALEVFLDLAKHVPLIAVGNK